MEAVASTLISQFPLIPIEAELCSWQTMCPWSCCRDLSCHLLSWQHHAYIISHMLYWHDTRSCFHFQHSIIKLCFSPPRSSSPAPTDWNRNVIWTHTNNRQWNHALIYTSSEQSSIAQKSSLKCWNPELSNCLLCHSVRLPWAGMQQDPTVVKPQIRLHGRQHWEA